MAVIELEILAMFVDEALDALVEWERCCLNLEQKANETDLNNLFRSAHNIKGASKAVGLEKLGVFVHQIENVITAIQKGNLKITPPCIALLLKGQAMLTEWVSQLKENPEIMLDTTDYCGQLNQILKAPEAPIPVPAESESPLEKFESNSKKKNASQSGPQGKAAETIRISAEKLSELIQLIGELSIHQAIVSHGFSTKSADVARSRNAANLMAKVIKDVQSRAMALRMQPLQGTFQRLERAAKDISRDLNKTIEFIVEGGDVDLDKTVTERIVDPLVHVVRNSVDHGIETKDERAKTGKPPVARIRLAAEQDANGVLITVTDDGRGMDPNKILKKAIEMKLCTTGEGLSKEEIMSFIFKAGFSTAEKVTAISGRGVGLDVVSGVVDELGGNLAVISDLGKGTQFRISLPTSLAIIEAIIIGVSSNRYVVPLRDINEIIDLDSFAKENSNGGQILSLRGTTVPVASLSTYLPKRSDVSEKSSLMGLKEGYAHQRPALVTVVDAKKIAFQVDSIITQQQVVVRDLSENLNNIPGLIGGTILADGEPGMIIGLETMGRAFLKQFGMEQAS